MWIKTKEKFFINADTLACIIPKNNTLYGVTKEGSHFELIVHDNERDLLLTLLEVENCFKDGKTLIDLSNN